MKRLMETALMGVLLAAGTLPLLADSDDPNKHFNEPPLVEQIRVRVLSPLNESDVDESFDLAGKLSMFYAGKHRDFFMTYFESMQFEIDCYIGHGSDIDADGDSDADSDSDSDADTDSDSDSDIGKIAVEGLIKEAAVSTDGGTFPQDGEWSLQIKASELNLTQYPAGTPFTLSIRVSGEYEESDDFTFVGASDAEGDDTLLLTLFYDSEQ